MINQPKHYPKLNTRRFLNRKIFVIILLLWGAYEFFLNRPMTSDGEIALVTRVKDGDSLQIKTSKGEKDLRILGIDAPELSQPFGKEAKETLQTLVENKNVTIVEPITDKYRRDLAYVLLTNTAFPKGIDVGAYMLEQGYAWYFNPDPKKDESYKKLEREARRKKKGLWSQDNPQEPVDYRHEEKSKSSKRFKFE